MSAPRPPQRTCVGCRRRADRAQLLRIVRDETPGGAAPVLRADPSGAAPGRGAWIHPRPDCLELARTRGGFARSFRSAVDPSRLMADLEAIRTHHHVEKVEEPMDIR